MTAVATGTLRVVVADDAEPLRALLCARLTADPRFEVVGQAANGDSAADVAIATRADAVLLDLSMPGTDGLHALRRLAAEAPTIRTVVLTGFRAGQFAGDVLELGAAAYVEKGVDLDDLAAVLTDACAGGERHAPSIVSPSTTDRVAPSPPSVRGVAPAVTDRTPSASPPRETRDLGEVTRWLLYGLVVVLTVAGLAASQRSTRQQVMTAHRDEVVRAADVAGAVITDKWTAIETAASVLVAPGATDEEALAFATALGGFTALVLDDDGAVAVSPTDSSLVGRRLEGYPHIDALLRGERIASDVVITPSGQRLVSIGVPLDDGRRVSVGFDSGAGLGRALVVGLPDEVVRAWVVDGRGEVIVETAGELAAAEQLLPPPTADDAIAGTGISGWTTTTSPIEGTSWRLVAIAPDTRVLADVDGLTAGLPWLFVALVASAGAVAVSAANRSRRAIDELGRTNRELATTNDDLEQFAYVASHDLQEPLRKVASYCQLLERRYGDRLDDDARVYIGYAVDGATRMQALLSDLLRYSRAGRVDRTSTMVVDLGSAIGNAVDALSLRISEAGATVVLPEEPPAVLADHTQVQQVVQNLVANALKFHEPGVAPTVRISAVSDGSMVRLSVADDGIGIAPEHHERIFGLFQRLHARDEFAGTGVGLAICRRMVERAGGRLWVTSTPGDGSTFHLTLPEPPRSNQ